MRKGTRASLLIVAAVATVATACDRGGTPPAGQDQPPPPTVTTTTPETRTRGQDDGAVEVARALRTAAGALPNGRAFDLEQETRNGERVWEVKVASEGREFTLDVSADGTQVVSRDEDNDPDDDVQKVAQTQVDAATAAESAAERERGRVTDVDLDTLGDGTLVWEVDLVRQDGARIEVKIDARTGDVTQNR
ncbi:hypothetical protein GCM10012275_34350 [Longimycelium tulufanense]|uniref:PepSY domain-containing protein n=1 Tax=Longimycelium tulufanense TaxID=907463 RepID=A0A8J3CCU3_9PSEU|nr:PepSY domain-containing protein [Longimycelium tulufanense]GGM60321.1 hypothetical protein GCM10012275_34350 [Longimycelium tulufanense]